MSPKVTSWGFRREMPAHYTMKMERGISVAGRVVDEAGRPIEGAALEFDVSAHQIDQAKTFSLARTRVWSRTTLDTGRATWSQGL